MLKVMTVVGTRPEIIRLSRVISLFDAHFEHTLVHTGQSYDYELSQVFFDELKIRKPDHFLDAAGATGSETIGKVIIAAERVQVAVRPDAVLVLGDTNSCMALLPAKRNKIATFHMEAGNRCFDQRVPEEINRRIVDHLADVNLTYSDIAREYLLREGLPPDLVIKTGSPMFEVLEYYRREIESSDALARLGLIEGQYFLVSVHREENVDSDDRFRRVVVLLNAVAGTLGMPVVVSTHPRTRKRIESTGVSLHPAVRLLRPLGFFDYNKLQVGARAVLSDSGTISEESSILNFPAINLREVHERPEAMEEASVIFTGLQVDRVFQALPLLERQLRGGERSLRLVGDYCMPNVAEKVMRIVLGYTDYVGRVIWKRY